MYIGDRSGTVFRVLDFAEVETFTVMDASVMGDPPTHGSVTRCRVGIQFTTAPAGYDARSHASSSWPALP